MSFGLNILQKYGWVEGKGLGRNESGVTVPIKQKLKFDKVGLGLDRSEEFTFHWWDHLYNKTAQNLNVGNKNSGKVTKKKEFRVETKKPTVVSQQKSAYGNFVKGNVLTGGQEIAGNSDSSDSEEEIDGRKDLMSTFSDDQLLKLCGGLTAHKGARHGINMTAKLARIENQERTLIEQSLRSSRSKIIHTNFPGKRTGSLPPDKTSKSNSPDKVIETKLPDKITENSSPAENQIKSILKVRESYCERKAKKLVHFKKEILVKLFSKKTAAFVMEVRKLKKKKVKPVPIFGSKMNIWTPNFTDEASDISSLELNSECSIIDNQTLCLSSKKKKKKSKQNVQNIFIDSNLLEVNVEESNIVNEEIVGKKKKKRKKELKSLEAEGIMELQSSSKSEEPDLAIEVFSKKLKSKCEVISFDHLENKENCIEKSNLESVSTETIGKLKKKVKKRKRIDESLEFASNLNIESSIEPESCLPKKKKRKHE